MTQISCLLWDFGDTLCDERFIWSGSPEWMEIYNTFEGDGLGAAWCLGELNTREFAAELSKHLGRSEESIVAHMTERCNHISFFQQTYEFFKARHLPQAIVTVNPDLFSDVVVPICGFAANCEVIVTSWEEGTIDKNILNRLAIERMGLSCTNEEAILIDNKRANIDRWVAIGGSGYCYSDDESFARHAASGIDALAGLSGA
ncbi:MAG: hypothetical protein O7E57_00100 [Gammaproteobacteria bacterium]|nr:hypothetical protein [Gammaproteobacteria bacterium]